MHTRNFYYIASLLYTLPSANSDWLRTTCHRSNENLESKLAWAVSSASTPTVTPVAKSIRAIGLVANLSGCGLMLITPVNRNSLRFGYTTVIQQEYWVYIVKLHA